MTYCAFKSPSGESLLFMKKYLLTCLTIMLIKSCLEIASLISSYQTHFPAHGWMSDALDFECLIWMEGRRYHCTVATFFFTNYQLLEEVTIYYFPISEKCFFVPSAYSKHRSEAFTWTFRRVTVADTLLCHPWRNCRSGMAVRRVFEMRHARRECAKEVEIHFPNRVSWGGFPESGMQTQSPEFSRYHKEKDWIFSERNVLWSC